MSCLNTILTCLRSQLFPSYFHEITVMQSKLLLQNLLIVTVRMTESCIYPSSAVHLWLPLLSSKWFSTVIRIIALYQFMGLTKHFCFPHIFFF